MTISNFAQALATFVLKTAKNLLKKSKAAGTDFYLALLAGRNTPSEGLESSPAQRMLGRRTRTLIPTTSGLPIVS